MLFLLGKIIVPYIQMPSSEMQVDNPVFYKKLLYAFQHSQTHKVIIIFL